MVQSQQKESKTLRRNFRTFTHLHEHDLANASDRWSMYLAVSWPFKIVFKRSETAMKRSKNDQVWSTLRICSYDLKRIVRKCSRFKIDLKISFDLKCLTFVLKNRFRGNIKPMKINLHFLGKRRTINKFVHVSVNISIKSNLRK